MKKPLPVLLSLFFMPFILSSQSVDTAAGVMQVDSLIQLSWTLAEQNQLDQAMEVNIVAERLTLEQLGKETTMYGRVCFTRARLFQYRNNLQEAERWYLEARAIREKVLGKDNLDYAWTVHNLANVYRDIREYAKSEELFLEAKAIREKIRGKESVDYANTLHHLGLLYYQMNNFQKAEIYYLEARDIWEKVLGKDNLDYAWTVNNLANVYLERGEYKKAEQLHFEVKAIREKLLGKESTDYAFTLHHLGLLYYQTSDFQKAEIYYLEARTIREKVLGKDNLDYAWTVNNLANVYLERGEYKKAEQLHFEVKAIREKLLSKESYDYAISLGNIGLLYTDTGQYEKSESYHLEAIAIMEKLFGKESLEYINCLYNLAHLYLDMGKYDKPERYFLYIKTIQEKKFGKLHANYAACLSSLAIFYDEMGDQEKAIPLFLEAKAIREKIQDKGSVAYTKNLNNLANAYYNKGDIEHAIPLYEEALNSQEILPGKDHPEYAWILNNLANCYISINVYDKAELLHLEAKAIRERLLGKESLEYANSLSNLSILNLKKGNYKECESLCLEAKTIRGKILGNSHPDYMTTLVILARLYTVIGSYDKVEPLYAEILVQQNAYAKQALTHLSERELNRFIHGFSEIEDQLLSFALKTGNQNNPTSHLCYDNSLFYKGFLLYTSSRIQQLAASNPANVEKFNQLKSCHRRLAREYAKPIAERKDVEELETQANDVEKDLAGTVAGYGEAIRQVNWQEVQQQLRPDEAAIEFVHYQYYNPNPTDSVMYAALLLRPGYSQPVFVPLFEEKQLLLLLSKDEATSSSIFFAQAYSRGITPAKNENYQGLYELVWQPLDTLLTGVKTVYYSPSGAIHRLNLSAIAVDKINTLTDRYQLVRLGSTRSLVVADTISSYANNSAALFGGIEYEADTTAADRDSTYLLANLAGSLSFANAERGVDQRGESWGALSGAKDEVTRIDKLLKSRQIKSQLWSDREATEEVFKNLGKTEPSPRIVHLATHGFFFPDPQAEIHSHGLGIQEPVFKLSEHPMIRSGLVLAGGNYAWKTGKSPHPDGEDGILTAYEISQMNLSNTELVVLSACETGLGDIEGNEGVYGLQRAFKIAGARYLIMSLWQVPDRETSVFMTRFYEHWLEERRPIPEAFQQTQQEMRRRFPNPYQWGGFILME